MSSYPSHYADDVAKTRAGLAVIGAAGVLSTIVTAALLGYVFFNGFARVQKSSAFAMGMRSFIHNPLGWFLLSLAISDFLQGIAFSINLYWVPTAGIWQGAYCNVQGAVSQVGDLGACIWSICISFHTFSLIFLQRKPAAWAPVVALLLGWIVILLLPILGATALQDRRGVPFWGDSGAWCWISKEYNLERIFFLHFFIYIALFSSAVVYSLIYLKLAGYLVYPRQGGPLFSSSNPLSPRIPASPWTPRRPEVVTDHVVKIARQLMWYPVVFTIVSVPVVVCRVRVLMGLEVPFGLYVLAGVCYASSGTTNAILFVLTRHALIQRAGSHSSSGAGGVRVTTHQVSTVDARLEGFQTHRRPEGTPLALKLPSGHGKESRAEDSASMFEDGLASADKVVSPVYPPQPQTPTWQ